MLLYLPEFYGRPHILFEKRIRAWKPWLLHFEVEVVDGPVVFQVHLLIRGLDIEDVRKLGTAVYVLHVCIQCVSVFFDGRFREMEKR